MEKYLARFTVLVGPKVRVNFIWGRRLQIDDADSCLSDFDNILRITSDVVVLLLEFLTHNRIELFSLQ